MDGYGNAMYVTLPRFVTGTKTHVWPQHRKWTRKPLCPPSMSMLMQRLKVANLLLVAKGWGKIGLCGAGGGHWSPFPGPPPLASRDGALKKVIDGGK